MNTSSDSNNKSWIHTLCCDYEDRTKALYFLFVHFYIKKKNIFYIYYNTFYVICSWINAAKWMTIKGILTLVNILTQLIASSVIVAMVVFIVVHRHYQWRNWLWTCLNFMYGICFTAHRVRTVVHNHDVH